MTRILVIDDDQSIRSAIELLLRHQDYVTILAENGRLGTEIFETSDFDVVMVDIFMPGINGLETIKSFRERAPTLPIIAMSGFRFRHSATPAPDFLGMATELGATYCLRKPFGSLQLLTAINACLSERASRSAARA